MIDGDDVNDMATISLFTTGPISAVAFVLMLVFAYYACENADECARMHCPGGQTPKLTEHACMCVTEAQP